MSSHHVVGTQTLFLKLCSQQHLYQLSHLASLEGGQTSALSLGHRTF